MAIALVANGASGGAPGVTLNTVGADLIVVFISGYHPLGEATIENWDSLNSGYVALTRRNSTNYNAGLMFYKLSRQGKAPRIYYVGNRPHISPEARREWRQKREAEAASRNSTNA